MQASEKVRSARKAQQQKRLDMKAKVSSGEITPESYSAYYAQQPLQRVKAAQNEEKRAARQAYKDARENLAVAEITGEGLEAAQEALAQASRVLSQFEPRSGFGAQLSAG